MAIRIVSCTVEGFESTPLSMSLIASKELPKLDLKVFQQNRKGLSERYNEAIDSSNPNDTLVFVHDDVEIKDDDLVDKLDKAFMEFDVVGLAGTRSWTLRSPAVWNNSPKDKWSGEVGHVHRDERWITPFGPVPQRCIIVDGLFIAVRMDRLGNVRFDQGFTFHHYDMDFCLAAHKAGLKIGTAPIEVYHHSIGDWTKDPVWYESEAKFLEKWSKKS